MENVDVTGRFKNWIRFGLIIPLALAAAVGYGAFNHRYHVEHVQIENAKVEGTLVAVRTLVDGKVNEIIFEDGAQVRAGDVIARLEVSVTDEAITQLESTVALAKQNYEDLKLGQIVEVPVKKIRTIPGAPIAISTPRVVEYYEQPSYGVSSSALASLEDRANRMEELYEMGAVSRVQRDAARQAYENALAESYVAPPQPIYVEENSIEYIQGEPTVIEEIEYVEQWQPTPPEALLNAENAIKQAELSLNVALQEAQETEVIAPVSGTIYYVTAMDGDLTAGNIVARIGDSNELWLAAEVSADIFDKVKLGTPVDYVIAGHDLSGTVIEKIAPNKPAEAEIPAEDTEADSPIDKPQSAWIPPSDEVSEPPEAEEPPAAESADENTVDEGAVEGTDAPANDKYVLKFSLPVDRDFECTPNTTTTVSVRIF